MGHTGIRASITSAPLRSHMQTHTLYIYTAHIILLYCHSDIKSLVYNNKSYPATSCHQLHWNAYGFTDFTKRICQTLTGALCIMSLYHIIEWDWSKRIMSVEKTWDIIKVRMIELKNTKGKKKLLLAREAHWTVVTLASSDDVIKYEAAILALSQKCILWLAINWPMAV